MGPECGGWGEQSHMFSNYSQVTFLIICILLLNISCPIDRDDMLAQLCSPCTQRHSSFYQFGKEKEIAHFP